VGRVGADDAGRLLAGRLLAGRLLAGRLLVGRVGAAEERFGAVEERRLLFWAVPAQRRSPCCCVMLPC
jgi:hypothetical protein